MTTLAADVVVADRFRLVQLIGKGGMGSVWRAIHLGLDTPCAVKFMEGALAETADAHARFEREAKAAAQLRSPNVVQIFEHGVWQGHPYIVMELLEGEDLGKHLVQSGGRLSAADVNFVVQHVCRALTRAHQAGVVHRDLKPDNIFIVKDDDRDIVKILDFGVAKSTGGVAPSSNTKTGALIGTPFYMSPEQSQGTKAVDARSDLWSLAVIVFQCLTGRLPFVSEALGDLLIKIMVAPIPMPSECLAGLPAAFDGWWLKASQRAPEARFQTAKELAESLSIALGQSSSGDATERKRMERGKVVPARGNETILTPLGAAPAPPLKTPPSQSNPPTQIAVDDIRVISGDEEVKALALGLREGIGRALAQNTAISVKTGDPTGAEFMLKGTVQAVGKRLRLSFALEEVATTRRVWAERYDRQLDDVFGLEDEIVALLASIIRSRIKLALFERVREAEDVTLTVPQLLDKAAGLFHVPSLDSNRKAVASLRVALERAPESSMATTMLAYGLFAVAEYSALALPTEATEEMLSLADRAVVLDPNSYVARSFKAMIVHELRGDAEAAHADASEALRRNANHMAARAMHAIADIHLGRVAQGVEQLRAVVAAGTEDASLSRHRRELAIAHWLNGDAAEGVRVAAKLWKEAPAMQRNAVVVAALKGAAGDLDDAKRQVAELQKSVPGLTLAMARLPQIGDSEARERFRDVLRQAGL
jgi:serine/threonine-protein kinase